MRGPSVKVAATQAASVSMILHELTTNALKYGALSVLEGTVHLTWDTPTDQAFKRVLIEWREEGRPAVVPPSGKGFGRRLIEMRAPADAGGTADFDFSPSGLRARITLPLL